MPVIYVHGWRAAFHAWAGENVASASVEELVNLAGELMTPIGFMYADEVLDRTYPNNKTAQLYKAILQPAMQTKGLLRSMQFLVKQQGGQLSRAYWEFQNRISHSSTLSGFLNAEAPIFRNEADVQSYLDRLNDKQDQLRRYLRNNKNSSMTVKLNLAPNFWVQKAIIFHPSFLNIAQSLN